MADEKHSVSWQRFLRITQARERNIHTKSVEISTLVYNDVKNQFEAKTKGGKTKIAYVVETPRSRSVFFANERDLMHIKNNNDLYPDLMETSTAVYIPSRSSNYKTYLILPKE